MVLLRRRVRAGWLAGWLALAGPTAADARAADVDAGANDAAIGAARAGAQAALSKGNRLFAQEDYTGALASYQRARALYPSTKLNFNIGQAHRALGHDVEATEAFDRFLAECGDAGPDLRREAQGYLQSLERDVGRLNVSSDVDGADLLVDGVERGQTPFGWVLAIKVGERVVRMEHPGYLPHEERVTVAPGATASLAFHLQRLPPPAPALASNSPPGLAASGAAAHQADLAAAPVPSPTTPLYKRWWFWSGVAAVVAGAAVGLLFATRSDGPLCPDKIKCYSPMSN